MKRAADLLTRTRRSVTDVSADLGFETIHHFSRRFKHFYGVSPVEYRHNHPDGHDGHDGHDGSMRDGSMRDGSMHDGASGGKGD